MSDAVQIVIYTGIIGIATMVIKHFIDEHAKKQTAKLEAVEVKIDGRLTQLLEITKEAYLAKGKEAGKAEQVEKHKTEEIAVVPPLPTGTTNLKIVEGEIKVKTEKPKKP